MDRKILINVDDTDARVALLEDGKLVGLQVEPYNDRSVVGNLYKGRVEGIVPGLKAAFVNIGFEKNAFLHFSDLHSGYCVPSHGRPRRAPAAPKSGEKLTVAPAPESNRTGPKNKRGPISLEVGDGILVQVVKEEIGDKGHRVTTNISLPGRYLVYLPYSENEGGVSRRIEDSEERRRLRGILKDIRVSKGSFIVRTAGLEQSQEAITADVRHLQRQWRSIERKASRAAAPVLIHNDHDLLYRLVRDTFAADESQVLIDDPVQARNLERAVKQLIQDSDLKVSVYDEPRSIFEAYDVERQIQRALKNKVWLKSGGYVVFEETEGMTAIDVNTGKYVGRGDQEETILRTNLEAAGEIANQLRVRDIGGIIVIDFIDMASRKNRETLLRELGRLLKEDRAKTSYSDISEFGVVQITRKRVRESLSKTLLARCPYCEGTGRVPSNAQIWKSIKSEMVREIEKKPAPKGLEISVCPEIRKYLEEEILEGIRRLANRHRITLTFIADGSMQLQGFKIKRIEKEGEQKAKPLPRRRSRRTASSNKSRMEQTTKHGAERASHTEARNPEKTLESTAPGADNQATKSPRPG